MTTKSLLASIVSAGVVFAAGTGASSGKSLSHNFSWLAGHWCLRQGNVLIEEQWLAPRGGLMLGMGRTVKDGQATAFEYTRIEFREGVPHYIAQPGGAAPTAFKLTAVGGDWARFENPAHDFPTRVEYRKTATGLHAEIAGPGKEGRELVIPFDYEACESPQ